METYGIQRRPWHSARRKTIPSDYRKAMGVLTTFLDKYNPDQLEIIGTRLELAKPIRDVAKADDQFQSGGRSFYIRTGVHELTCVYDRIVIRAKITTHKGNLRVVPSHSGKSGICEVLGNSQ